MGKLSHTLLDLGFFCALGTTERASLERGGIVHRGTPFTLDHNNGVTVIHDEDGRPWIIRNDQLVEDEQASELGKRFKEMCNQFPIKRGACVPHSNDGGHFIRTVLPTL